MATNTVTQAGASGEKKKRHRSPNYPAIGLKEAIDRVKQFISIDGRAGAAPALAAKHIGFSSAHGQAYSALAALKKFGLVEEKDGRIVPTQRAIEINSLPETDERRKRAIGAAALSPPLYMELIEQYRPTGFPADETLAGELEAYKGFNPNGVKEFLKGLRETMEFAGLSDSSVLASEKKAENEQQRPKIGDWVQWEHNGILGLPQSKKLVRFSEDGQFGFVEGGNTGLPISEIIPADPPQQSSHQPLLNSVLGGQGAKMRQDVFSLAEGEAVIHWPTPLSDDSIRDLEDWLELVKRKIKRSAAEVSTQQQIETPPGQRQVRLED
jgi:hypothetical protein